VMSQTTVASNVELLIRWIPAPALDPDPGFAGMTNATVSLTTHYLPQTTYRVPNFPTLRTVYVFLSLTPGARPDATNGLTTDTWF